MKEHTVEGKIEHEEEDKIKKRLVGGRGGVKVGEGCVEEKEEKLTRWWRRRKMEECRQEISI